MKTFTQLANANKNHYDEHPGAHMTYLAVYCVVAAVACGALIKRLVKEDPTMRSGQYAK